MGSTVDDPEMTTSPLRSPAPDAEVEADAAVEAGAAVVAVELSLSSPHAPPTKAKATTAVTRLNRRVERRIVELP
jgi:hypothetical protein